MPSVLIVDDEGVARNRLDKLLSAHPDFQVIGEAEDGESAIRQIESLRPDLVFLDVQMPVCDGLEVAGSLGQPLPEIIFCTAYDQYAVEAFDLNAVDYLLKPVSRLRLAKALERFRRRQAMPDKAPVKPPSLADPPSRFLAKYGNRFLVVDRDQIIFFSSEEGLTQLNTEKQTLWMQPSLGELEKRLAGAGFFRISRSSLVNLLHVTEVAPVTGGYGQVLLSCGLRLDVSRRRFKALLESLGP